MTKCRQCSTKLEGDFYIMAISKYCDRDCAVDWMLANPKKAKKVVTAKIKKQEKEQRKKDKGRLDQLKKRVGKNGYYDNLKTQLHGYIKHVLRKGESCYTCGKNQSPQ